MNHPQRQKPRGAPRALRNFALLAAVLSGREALAALHLVMFCPIPVTVTVRGYLPVVGTPELRFQEPIPPSVRPATKSSAAATPGKSSGGDTSSEPVVLMKAPSAWAQESAKADISPDEKLPQKTKAGASQRILPDDARPVAHPEDFLPFFHFPTANGSSSSLDVIVPVPAGAPSGPPLPPSSANYSQSPSH
jgi:hypothetical protein